MEVPIPTFDREEDRQRVFSNSWSLGWTTISGRSCGRRARHEEESTVAAGCALFRQTRSFRFKWGTPSRDGLILDPNGSLLCGRPGDAHGGKSSNEVKIYEVHRTRRKGDAEPAFGKIPHKSVMTLVANVKVVDVAFGGARDEERCDVAVVCGVDGSVQVWDLDVEYRFAGGADPKLPCSTALPRGEEDGEVKKIVAVAAIAAGGGDGGASNVATTRVAVATDDSALHLFTYSPGNNQPSISLDFTIDDTHPEGVGDVRFCPSSSGKVLYTMSAASNEVFAWNVE